MSRVFDALKRAGEERKTAVEVSPDRKAAQADGILDKANERSQTTALTPREILNQESPQPKGNLDVTFPAHTNHNLRPRSWRERLENFLIGSRASRVTSHPLVSLEKNSPAAEQYKILREQIKKMRADSGARCLAVTSPVKRDGKTMVAVNLAAAMALDYEGKILLIDGDLRRPELHNYFGVDPSPGLGDFLAGTSNGNLKSYLRDTFISGFQIIPGGKASHFSSELLAQEKMRSLMEEIRARFPEHQIILDAPPVLSTPDPLVLGRLVDGIVVVVRAGKTPRDYLSKTVQALDSAKVMGVVLNGIKLGTSSKYYSYSTKNS
jgi:protein-tyrosine kinase